MHGLLQQTKWKNLPRESKTRGSTDGEWEPRLRRMISTLRSEHLRKEQALAEEHDREQDDDGQNEPGTSSAMPIGLSIVPEFHTPYDWVVAFGGIPPWMTSSSTLPVLE